MIRYFTIIALSIGLWACAQESTSKPRHKKEEAKKEVAQAEEGVHWVTVNEAMELQKREPKKILIDFYTSWCGPCKLLEKNTFENPDVAEYINEHFYAVRFNAEGNEVVNFKDNEFVNANYKETNGRGAQHPFAAAFQVRAYPTVVFLDEDTNFIFPMQGYMDAKGIEPTLKVIASDAYKTIKSREEFETWSKETFVSTFN